MDPNANLEHQERILAENREVYAARKSGDADRLELALYYARGNRSELQELRNCLASWLNSGGFQPDWSKAPRAAKYYGH